MHAYAKAKQKCTANPREVQLDQALSPSQTKLQLVFRVYSSNRTVLEELEPFHLDASSTSTNEIDMESSSVGMVTLSYTKSYSDCIDDSGLGAGKACHVHVT